MAEQIPRARPKLRLVSREDAVDAAARRDRLDTIMTRAEIRDQAAEQRDRRVDRRSPGWVRGQAEIDRVWAGRDRDEAAIERADLVALLHERQEIGLATQPVIDEAKGIPVAGSGATSDEALVALTTAAHRNEPVVELAECLVADQDIP